MTVKSVASIDGIARIPLRIEDGTLKYSIESEDGTYTITGGIALNNLESGEVKDLTPEGGNIYLFNKTFKIRNTVSMEMCRAFCINSYFW